MNTVQRATLFILFAAYLAVSLISAYVGIHMHSGPSFDFGSFVQWCALGMVSLAVTGMLYAVLNGRG